jgi:1-acyl-sn-glycerol-3-phosphate acyltransferase
MMDLSFFEFYETPDDVKLSLRRFLLGRRLSLYLDAFKIIIRSRILSSKGVFTDRLFFDASDGMREAIEKHGGKFEVTGLQNMQTQGPFVIVANHMGVVETQLMPWVIGSYTPLSMVMKESLYNSWLYGPIALATKSIGLSRQNLKADIDTIMKEGVALLSKGRSIVLFPEGTRKEYFSRKEFNSLGAKLAARAGAKVVPVAVKTDFLEAGKVSSYMGPIHPDRKIRIAIGEPMKVEGRGKQEHELCLDFIEKNLKEWGFPVKENS